MYWLDHTDLDQLRIELDNNQPAIMVIEIDGYDDVIKSTPEDNQSLIRVDIEKIISKLEDETEGQIEKLANDKYVLFTNKMAIKKLEKCKFPILDEAREIDRDNSLPVSLSVGVGYDGKTIEETGKFASGAIDMVLGRGGDQVAVKNGDGYNFFGGKSKGFERKTKVKSRLIGHAFREIVSQSDDILIMGHHYPDMDAMGAAVGVFDICKSYGKKAHIVLDEVNEAVEIFVNRVKEEKYFKDIFISHERAIDMCKSKTLVVVVDTHRPSYTECQKLLNLSNRVVVIDHHRRGVEYINETILLFHEIYVSSTCEMVTELIQYTDFDIKIHKLTAEGLLGGIYLDTKNFEFKTGVRTFEAASYLRNLGAEKNGLAIEDLKIGIILSGREDKNLWNQSKTDYNFYDLKGYLEFLFERLNVTKYSLTRLKDNNFHPGASAEIKIGEDVIGVFGELHPNLVNYFGIKREKLFFAEINLTKLLKYIKIKVNYESISKYPEVLRDLAITLDRDILVGDMIKEIKKKVALIEKIDIFDVYSGDKIDKDKKSVAMSIVLRDKNRTLTDEDIDTAMNTILELIKEKYNGEIRK